MKKNKTGVGIGTFDGVHLGHRFLVSTLVNECNKRNIRPCVFTFRNHPYNLLHPENPVKLIMGAEKKAELLREAGAHDVIFENFTEEIAKMPPERFAEEIIAKELNAALVVVGENFTFGAKGSGTPDALKEYGQKYGFEVIVVPPVKRNGLTVSSTLLRKLVAEGRVDEFAELAGGLYTIPGNVQHGREIGRTMGFPTANIEQDRAYVMPLPGVYETLTTVGENTYPGVTNVGNNPTFNLKHIVVETHLLDYDRDIYGKYIEVGFVRRIRGEIKFESIEDLKKQIEEDKNSVLASKYKEHNI